jgi:hypothetical protein
MHIRCVDVVRGDPYGMLLERGDRDTNPACRSADEYLVPFVVPCPIRRVEMPLDEGGF